MWSLTEHALVHDGDLAAYWRLAGYKTELGELAVWVFHYREIHRGVAHRTAETGIDKAGPRRGTKAPREQAAARCFQSKQAAVRGWYADRAAPIGAMGERQDPGGNACRRAAARSARAVFETPRIMRWRVQCVLRAVDQTHLGHVGDAHNDERGTRCRGE